MMSLYAYYAICYRYAHAVNHLISFQVFIVLAMS